MIETKVQNSLIHLTLDDLTAMKIEAIVYYAQHDLKLGSGFGNAIAVRGGAAVQEELNGLGPLQTCDAVVTTAGELQSNYIVHAVGPRFQEEDTESKLRKTIENALFAAQKKGIKRIAFPPMGYGFYGIPLDLTAKVMIDEFQKYQDSRAAFEQIIVCVMDQKEYKAFESILNN